MRATVEKVVTAKVACTRLKVIGPWLRWKFHDGARLAFSFVCIFHELLGETLIFTLQQLTRQAFKSYIFLFSSNTLDHTARLDLVHRSSVSSHYMHPPLNPVHPNPPTPHSKAHEPTHHAPTPTFTSKREGRGGG